MSHLGQMVLLPACCRRFMFPPSQGGPLPLFPIRDLGSLIQWRCFLEAFKAHHPSHVGITSGQPSLEYKTLSPDRKLLNHWFVGQMALWKQYWGLLLS